MAKEYRCEHCQGVFEEGWTDEEAFQEFHENFPEYDIEDTVRICDDCYKSLMPVGGWPRA